MNMILKERSVQPTQIKEMEMVTSEPAQWCSMYFTLTLTTRTRSSLPSSLRPFVTPKQTERLMLIEELKSEQKYAHCYRE